ncbi:MAG TPA: molybdenum cofactor biosynthesis protein MoaE, partial [Rhizobiales bacterium]|nr:molybdenum cofactor biosynthesis protein MoaE [Hyphomicrobiales bacterium]
FWKRETGPGGSRWVEASSSDATARTRWNKTKDAAE